LEIGDGDNVVMVETILPDEAVSGQLTATFYSTYEPETTETVSATYALKPRTDTRVSGRQHRIKLSEPVGTSAIADGTYLADGTITASGPSAGTDFRIGTFRLSYIVGGRR
jgi:hypothetical protein